MAIVISGVNNNDKITASDGSIDLLSSVGFASTVNAPDLTVSNRISGKFIDVSNDIQLGTAGIVTALTFAGNVTGNINNNTLLLQTGGTERIRITSAGRVGIASASPSDVELDVCRRNTVSNAQIRLYNDLSGSGNHTIMRFKVQGTSASNFIYFGDADSDNIAQLRYQHSSDSLQYFYNNNEKLRIDSEGRILSRHSASRTVGTKTGQLQVIESGNNAAISIIQTNNAASAPFLALGKTRSANDTDSTIVQNNDSLGQILFCGADGTDVDSIGAWMLAQVDGTPGSNDMPGRLIFSTSADGSPTPTERLRITSSGKVGIGITNPSQRLTVQGAILKTRSDSGIGIIYLTNDPSNNGQILVNQNQGVTRVKLDSAGTSYFTGGKVGINSTSPQGQFDVMHNDGVYIKTATNGAGAKINFTDASQNGWDQIGTIEYKHQDNVIINGMQEAFRIAGTETNTGVQIEGLLKVTRQPCAVVYQCTGPAGGAANATSDNKEPLHFDHVHINQGGMTISQNNARIQVPVTGIYFVSYMVSGTVTNVDLNDGIELLLLVNGNEYPATNSGAEPVFNFGAAANQEEFFANNTLLVSLSKDDYVEVAVDNIGSSDANINRGNFSIMLMA